MRNQTMYEGMQMLLIGILFLIIYLLALMKISSRLKKRQNILMVAGILFFLFFCGAMCCYVLIQLLGETQDFLMILLFMASVIILCERIWFAVHNFHEMNMGAAALFFTYLLAILYITLFSRIGTHNTSIKTTVFADLQDYMYHFILNSALFIPFGGLLMAMYPKKKQNLVRMILTGMMLSVFIETIQMILQIGECDIKDILGNTLGTFLGCLSYRLMRKGFHDESVDD